MTLAQERIIDVIASLPDDDWQPADWDAFSAAQVAARADRDRRVRHTERKAQAKAQRPQRQREGWTSVDGYAAVDARSGGRCEHPLGCSEPATHHHHIAGRKGDDPNHPDLLLHVCVPHHNYIHANPKLSYANGTMKRRNGQVR